jgi:hypothetical protein
MKLLNEIPLTKSQLRWVKAELSNNETDSDNDLIEWFTDTLNISRDDARGIVSYRNYYLNKI